MDGEGGRYLDGRYIDGHGGSWLHRSSGGSELVDLNLGSHLGRLGPRDYLGHPYHRSKHMGTRRPWDMGWK